MTRVQTAAERSHQATLDAYRHKIAVIQQLIKDGDLDRLPTRLSLSAIASWINQEVGVKALSRTVLYQTGEDYTGIRDELKRLLGQIMVLRRKTSRRANLVPELRQKIIEQADKLQCYVNDYSKARSEVINLQQENQRLQEKLQRVIRQNGQIMPLRDVKTDE